MSCKEVALGVSKADGAQLDAVGKGEDGGCRGVQNDRVPPLCSL